MRTLWRALVRTVFWSFERGTWPYDVAVAVIVIFVLLSPRSWFHDRPPLGSPPSPAMVQFRGIDSAGEIETYRVDARLLSSQIHTPESQLEHDLHDAMRKSVARFARYQQLRDCPYRTRSRGRRHGRLLRRLDQALKAPGRHR